MAVLLGNHRFIADLSSLPELFFWVKDQLNISRIFYPPEFLQKIEISLEEVFVNISSYAYPYSKEDSFIEISLQLTPDQMLEITICDWGVSYNPIDSHVKKIRYEKNNVCPVSIGGHGTKLILELSKFAKYERDGNSNRLTLLFPYPQTLPSALS